jgi:hypothetical protein
MTCTINGKEWTEFDINYRCASLIGSKLIKAHPSAKLLPSLRTSVITDLGKRDYCNDPADTDAIIDKCWDELNEIVDKSGGIATYGTIMKFEQILSKWKWLAKKHNCTKLVAACICYIEINEAAL